MLTLFLLIACSKPLPCPGLPGEVPVTRGEAVAEGDWDALEDLIAAEMEAGCLPGLGAAIVDEDGILWEAGFGWADLEAGAAVTPDTAFALASVSKAVGGVALMKAREDGFLELEDPVGRHVPFEVTNPRLGAGQPAIRLSHLASHSSGIRDDWDVLDATYVPGDPEDDLAGFLEAYLVQGGAHFSARGNFYAWEPGRQWYYSNVGAALAALAVQGATGQPYDDYCETELFGPLGMDRTHWFLEDYGERDPIALPYEVDAEQGWVTRGHYGFATWPDGQLRSTTGDMGRLLGMVVAEGTWNETEVLAADSVDRMLTEPAEGLTDVYLRKVLTAQYVFWHETRFEGRRLVGHDGGDYGVFTRIAFDPTTGIGVVLLANYADGDLGSAPFEAFDAAQLAMLIEGEEVGYW